MAGNKTALKAAIKQSYMTVKNYDGSAGQTTDDAIDKLAADITDAIDSYVKSLKIVSNPGQVGAATLLAAGQYPVAAANNLESNVVDA